MPASLSVFSANGRVWCVVCRSGDAIPAVSASLLLMFHPVIHVRDPLFFAAEKLCDLIKFVPPYFLLFPHIFSCRSVW